MTTPHTNLSVLHVVAILTVAATTLVATACAHHDAIRANCDGPLRPINQAITATEPPVIVHPIYPEPPKQTPDDGDLFP